MDIPSIGLPSINIPPHILAECYRHGIEAYPEEACGLITESAEGVLEKVCRTRNLMDEFHCLEPDKYPRTNRNGYVIDPLEMLRLEELGCRLRVVYHSHPGMAAYFSEEDQDKAFFNGRPWLLGIDYLVLGIEEGKPNGAVLAVFNMETGAFDIERIE